MCSRYNFTVNAAREGNERNATASVKRRTAKCQGVIIYSGGVPLESRRVFLGVNCNLRNDNAVALSFGNTIIPSTSGKVSIFSCREYYIYRV